MLDYGPLNLDYRPSEPEFRYRLFRFLNNFPPFVYRRGRTQSQALSLALHLERFFDFAYVLVVIVFED